MKIMTKLKKKQICTALTCGLLFTVGGQWEKAEATEIEYNLYGVTEDGAAVIESAPGPGVIWAQADKSIIGKRPATEGASNTLESGVVFSVLGGEWKNVYGGIGNSSDATANNKITISGGTVKLVVVGGDAGSSTSAVTNNIVNIGGSASVNYAVYGGRVNVSSSAEVKSNIVNINGGTVKGNIYGGFANGGNAADNKVVIDNIKCESVFADGALYIVGGLSSDSDKSAKGNSVTIKGGTFTSAGDGHTIQGGSAGAGTATENTVTIEGGTFDSYVSIYGGRATAGDASSNTINISGKVKFDAPNGDGNEHGQIQLLLGGMSDSGKASNNVINISGGSFAGSGYGTAYYGIGGGYVSGGTGKAENNVVNISGGKFEDIRIFGAWGQDGTNNNTVNISGGSFTNVNVYAGANSTVDVFKGSGNTVNLIGKGGTLNVTRAVTKEGTPVTEEVSNTGTALKLGTVSSGRGTGSILNVAGTDTKVDEITGFANVNFVTNGTMTAGSTMLTAGTADITGAKVNAALSGKLADGTFTLLTAGRLTDTDAKYSINGTEVTLGTKLSSAGDNNNYLALRNTSLAKSGNSLQLQNENWGAVGTYNGEGKETATLSEGDTGIKNVAGAYSDTGDATGGKVIINGGSYENVYGGYSVSGAVTGNTVNINGGTITNVYGGYSSNTDAVKNNVIAVSGGEITGTLKAEKELTLSGGTFSGTADISAAGSTVKISGSTVSGIINGNEDETNGTDINITGGTLEGTAKITGNTITLNGNTNTESFLGGTLAAHLIDLKTTLKGSAHLVLTGPELNIRTLNNTAADISVPAAGGELNFYIPKEATDGSTMLTLKEDTKISNSKVTVGIQNGSALKVKDKINLITMEGGKLTAENLTYLQPGESVIQSENLAKQYKLKTEANENGMVTTVSSLGPGENSKSYVETMAANLAMLNMSSDLMAGAGLEQAAMAANSEGEQNTATLSPFAAMSGKKMRSHSGSYVDSRSWGIDVGMSKTINNRHGKLLFGPLVEYAKGSYDSHLDNGTRGDGNSHSWGIGGFAKQEFKDGTYLEGSLRAGRISSDYQSAELGSYNTSATYISAHLGLGQEKQLGAKDSIDYYGKYFYTHQSSDDVNIHEGGSSDRYHFDAVKSSRMKLGLRWNHQVNKYNTLYLGGAWQYEFDGSARATYEGEAAPSPSVKGSTGIFELGWKTKSSKGGFETGLGLTGSIGKQEGIGMNAYFQWNF